MANYVLGKDKRLKVLNFSVPKEKVGKFTAPTVAEAKRDYIGISGAPSLLGVGYGQYVRRLVGAGRLFAIKVAIRGGSKWLISKESIEEYVRVSSRSAMRRNYTLRIDRDNESKVRSALEALGIKYDLELSFRSKSDD